MDIRGVGPSYGATGPSNDPKQQALADLDHMNELLDKIKSGDANPDVIADLNKTMADLNSLKGNFDPGVQMLIDLASDQVGYINNDLDHPKQLSKDISNLQANIEVMRNAILNP